MLSAAYSRYCNACNIFFLTGLKYSLFIIMADCLNLRNNLTINCLGVCTCPRFWSTVNTCGIHQAEIFRTYKIRLKVQCTIARQRYTNSFGNITNRVCAITFNYLPDFWDIYLTYCHHSSARFCCIFDRLSISQT